MTTLPRAQMTYSCERRDHLAFSIEGESERCAGAECYGSSFGQIRVFLVPAYFRVVVRPGVATVQGRLLENSAEVGGACMCLGIMECVPDL